MRQSGGTMTALGCGANMLMATEMGRRTASGRGCLRQSSPTGTALRCGISMQQRQRD